MQPMRPVAIGLILGLLTLGFGIFWAAYITAGHDSIHKTLEEKGRAAVEGKFVLSSGGEKAHVHDHASHSGHGGPEAASPAQTAQTDGQGHEDSAMEEAHERLVKGHLHAMGLGLVTLTISIVLGFLNAPARIKTVGSAFAGVGGVFYPLSWIVMGFRTTALGPEIAQESVFPIAAFSILLVLAGIALAVIYAVKGLFSSDCQRC